MTTRQFYKRTITLEILSEDKIQNGVSLQQILWEAVEGNYSMQTVDETNAILTGKEAAAGLFNQGSDPSFFQLTDDGNDA